MGVMRFAVQSEGLLNSDSDLSQIYVSGFDGRVFASRVEFEGEQLVLQQPRGFQQQGGGQQGQGLQGREGGWKRLQGG